MGILSWIIFGLLAGALGKFFMPGPDPRGWIITMVLGIVGAVIGGFIATQMGVGSVDGFNFGSLVVAILGTMLVLGVYRLLQKRQV